MAKKLTIADNIKEIVKKRYYQQNETIPQQMIRRVADFVAQGESLYGYDQKQIKELSDKYYNTMNQKLWISSSPFLMNTGTKIPMCSACFLVGGLHDTIGDIFNTLYRVSKISKMGGGIGLNFSLLREEGSEIETTGGCSSGVLSFMELFDKSGEVIKQGGRRRAANMGILEYNHPEILKFLDYKNDHTKLNNFNISVLVDDIFMNKVLNNEEYDLVSPKDKKVVGKINAKEVFNKLVKNNWSSAEPALLFRNNINKDNPMKDYLGDITGVNACGEIAMYYDECCMLSSINLEEFVDWNKNVNWDLLEEITRLNIRFLDTTIDIQMYPDKDIEEKVKSLRRLGLGVMSLHGALLKAGYKYSSQEGRDFAENLMKFINEKSWGESKNLAKEKGTFPLFEHSSFIEPVRNVGVTCIAPTGTIQQIVNTSSSGCEPAYAWAYKRLIDGKETFWVNPFFEEYAKEKGFWNNKLAEKIYKNNGSVKGLKEIPKECQELFETAMEISPKDHILMQAVLQKHVTNSISKTINMPEDITEKEISDMYLLGWKSGLKGMTIYRNNSRKNQVLSVNDTKKEKKELKRGEIIKAKDELKSQRFKLKTGCGSLYLHLSSDENNSLTEVFSDVGQGNCVSHVQALSRMISLALRGGISVSDIADQLQSACTCPSYISKRVSGQKVSPGKSCPSAIAKKMLDFQKKTNKEEKEIIIEKEEIIEEIIIDKCPECGEKLHQIEGCKSCACCGFSRCN